MRSGHRNTFFAVCIEIVLAPSSPPSPLWYCSQAISIALQSKPKCRQKRWSSLAITARISAGEMSSSGRQFLRIP